MWSRSPRCRLLPAVLVLLLGGSALLAGCEDSFELFEESDVAFSLFGYLDAAADTQFVRVDVLRESAFDTEPVEADVTLEALASGEVVALRDSVVRFDNGAAVHNYWTTMPIGPASAYRLTATDPDGRSATVTIETPPNFPNPELESGLSPYSSAEFPPTAQSMTLRGIETIADLRVTYELADPDVTVTVSYLDNLILADDGDYLLSFNAYADVQRAVSGGEGTTCPALRSARVFMAAATADWPDFTSIDREALARANTISNVEGGLGFVGGVLTRSGPWGSMRTVFDLHREGCQR